MPIVTDTPFSAKRFKELASPVDRSRFNGCAPLWEGRGQPAKRLALLCDAFALIRDIVNFNESCLTCPASLLREKAAWSADTLMEIGFQAPFPSCCFIGMWIHCLTTLWLWITTGVGLIRWLFLRTDETLGGCRGSIGRRVAMKLTLRSHQ